MYIIIRISVWAQVETQVLQLVLRMAGYTLDPIRALTFFIPNQLVLVDPWSGQAPKVFFFNPTQAPDLGSSYPKKKLLNRATGQHPMFF